MEFFLNIIDQSAAEDFLGTSDFRLVNIVSFLGSDLYFIILTRAFGSESLYKGSMLIVRPTHKLAKRMKIKLPLNSSNSTGKLGDWYCADIQLSKRQFILAVSGTTRLAVLMTAAPYSDFPARLPLAIAQVLKAFKIPQGIIDQEISSADEIALGKTDNRSVLGSLNDYCSNLRFLADSGQLDLSNLINVSAWLSSIPSLVMEAVFPYEATRELFGLGKEKEHCHFKPPRLKNPNHLQLIKS